MSLSYSKSLNHGKAQLTEISEEASAEKMHVADTEKEVSKFTSTSTPTRVDEKSNKTEDVIVPQVTQISNLSMNNETNSLSTHRIINNEDISSLQSPYEDNDKNYDKQSSSLNSEDKKNSYATMERQF